MGWLKTKKANLVCWNAGLNVGLLDFYPIYPKYSDYSSFTILVQKSIKKVNFTSC